MTLTTLLLIALCALLFYLFNELEDAAVRDHFAGKLQKWNVSNSWTNKWAAPWPQPAHRRWYYFGYKPAYRERFAYSSTLLVWLTDAEHFFQCCKFRCIEIALFLISWQIALAWIAGKAIMAFVKEVFIKAIK